MKKPPIKVIHRKLGKHKAIGLAYCEERVIHIDERLKGEEWFYVILHECLHVQNPKWSEIKVIGHSREMASIVWREWMKKMGVDTTIITPEQ